MRLRIDSFEYSERFGSDFRGLDAGLVKDAKAALELLKQNPRANSLRAHTLKGGGKPTIYKIDINSNKSYQITFILDGTKAVLLRIGTHRQLDRSPV